MCTRRLMAVLALAAGLVLCSGTAPVWAGDVDGDGVDDAIDVCNNTPLGIAVDAQGRPLGDIDQDCDTDLDDFALFQQGMTGPLSPAGMVPVPGGEYDMGDPFNEGDTDERPVHTVYVTQFYIDRHEVSNRQYAAALNWAWRQGGLITVSNDKVYQAATGILYCDINSPSDPVSRITWNGCMFGVVPGREDHPMVRVTWFGAAAYSNWRSIMESRTPSYDMATWDCDFEANGYRLPTEAEWEKAAAWNPIEQRHFRFGEHTDGCGTNCLDGHRANYLSSGDPYETGNAPWTTPGGYYNGSAYGGYQTQDAGSPYGCYDMSGNVREWCHDWYSSDYYSWSPQGDPHGPGSGTVRVTRGGAYNFGPSLSRSADRTTSAPELRHDGAGFRLTLVLK